jgi:hypothetical protein
MTLTASVCRPICWPLLTEITKCSSKQFSAHPGTAGSVARRLEARVEKGIYPRDASAHRIRHTTRCTAMQARGHHHPNLCRMPDARIDLPQHLEKQSVFRQRHHGHTAHATIRGNGHCDAGAAVLVMSRPWVGGIGIEQRSDFIQQCGIATLAGVDRVQVLGDQSSAQRFDLCPTCHRIRAAGDRCEIGGRPAGRHPRVRVDGEQDAVRAGKYCGPIHCNPSGHPGTGAIWRKRQVHNVYLEGQHADEPANHSGTVVGAVIQADDHATDSCGLLGRKRQQAAFQFVGFVPGGDSD